MRKQEIAAREIKIKVRTLSFSDWGCSGPNVFNRVLNNLTLFDGLLVETGGLFLESSIKRAGTAQ
jgi:hypothetical protein